MTRIIVMLAVLALVAGCTDSATKPDGTPVPVGEGMIRTLETGIVGSGASYAIVEDDDGNRFFLCSENVVAMPNAKKGD